MNVKGVKIFNSLPSQLKTWDGSQEVFKANLDKYLESIPDNPITDSLTPDCTDYKGTVSNSIVDWSRKLDLHDFTFNSKAISSREM